MTNENKIVNGPSKFDLCFAFFSMGNPGERRPIDLTVNHPEISTPVKVKVIVNSLEWEDGSGESWNFTGYAFHSPYFQDKVVRGYFNTRKRKGWIEVV
jgi:hypothetical protein